MNLFGAVLNAAVVITIFVITFSVIDKRNLQKDDNARNTANILILSTYKRCKEILSVVNNGDYLEKFIVPKVDFNKSDLDSQIIMNLKNGPFEAYVKILDLASAGAVDATSLSKYCRLMELYKSYVSMRITFFDIHKYEGSEHKQLQNRILEERNEIEELLNSEITRLKNEIGNNEDADIIDVEE